ncbi:TspO/MBR family protein [Paludisphaera borealis]|uniref:Tryptophan-rich protein TspO n=1 Tax=Paludisphaera borealis TaxID=1387353 RepID=A0A1U7CNE6_9BACT|nr:TspO/MBR family protein [Paludisphaera borealis]APW60438.1 Tryptophan-rich protein TspO [Paludisphaera borealis]
MIRKRPLLLDLAGLLGFVILSFSAAAIGTAATIPNLSPWYAGLRKPPWIPPSSLFGPVWTVLYLLMSLAAWLVWRHRNTHREDVQTALGCFVFQLALNAAWSWLFFGLHQTGLAFAEILSLWLVIAATILSFFKISRGAALLLVPYLLWVSFAAVLNGAIHRLN